MTGGMISVALRSALCADCWHTDGPLHGSSDKRGSPDLPTAGGGGERTGEGGQGMRLCKLTPVGAAGIREER